MKDITWTTMWPLSRYYAAYIDLKKSVPHKNELGIVENRPGYPYWIPEQRYLANVNDYLDVISNIKHDEFIFNDPISQKPLLKFWVEKGKSAIYDGKLGNGMIFLQYNIDELLAIRKRDDGLLGIQSIHIDTRLSIAENLKKPGLFPRGIKTTNKHDANFSNLVKLKKKGVS